MASMRNCWSRALAGCAASLTMLAGCTGGPAETGERLDSPSVEVGALGEASPDDSHVSAQPRETADPCEGRNDDFLTQIRCDIVAWADLDLDGTLEPIAVATGGEPSINLVTVIDGETLAYSSSGSETGRAGFDRGAQGIGPDVGSMEARRHAAFVGAYDMTGDGRPELVMWADKRAYFDEFRVLTVGAEGLKAIDTPQVGMNSAGQSWVHYLDLGRPSYRCTDDSDAPLEMLAGSPGDFTSTKYEFDELTDEFVSLGDRRPMDEWTGAVPTVGVACTDHAQHEPTPDPDGPAPGESERCPLGQLPGTAHSGDRGGMIEGQRTTGQIGCERISKVWDEYQKAPKDPMTNGKSLIVDFGDHTCSKALTVGVSEAGAIGTCTAMDQSWAFQVVPR